MGRHLGGSYLRGKTKPPTTASELSQSLPTINHGRKPIIRAELRQYLGKLVLPQLERGLSDQTSARLGPAYGMSPSM